MLVDSNSKAQFARPRRRRWVENGVAHCAPREFRYIHSFKRSLTSLSGRSRCLWLLMSEADTRLRNRDVSKATHSWACKKGFTARGKMQQRKKQSRQPIRTAREEVSTTVVKMSSSSSSFFFPRQQICLSYMVSKSSRLLPLSVEKGKKRKKNDKKKKIHTAGLPPAAVCCPEVAKGPKVAGWQKMIQLGRRCF